MEGEWRGMPVALEWVPNDYLTLTTRAEDDTEALIVGVKEILGFLPTISYVDPQGQLATEWHVKEIAERLREIQGNPNYRNVKRYKK
jgi:hypothetical protein